MINFTTNHLDPLNMAEKMTPQETIDTISTHLTQQGWQAREKRREDWLNNADPSMVTTPPEVEPQSAVGMKEVVWWFAGAKADDLLRAIVRLDPPIPVIDHSGIAARASIKELLARLLQESGVVDRTLTESTLHARSPDRMYFEQTSGQWWQTTDAARSHP